MRRTFIAFSILSILTVFGLSQFWSEAWKLMILLGPIILIGFIDMTQNKHSIRKNFPFLGNFRYLFESIRPEINQYFVESNRDGMPFNREQRSVVYQRAKNQLDTLPFGTQINVYAIDYEWINHSLAPKPILKESPRILIGGPDCKQPYSAAIFNISAMSYGSLSKNAILALNLGAKIGHFYHNTGEGGLSPYHLQNGGDITWQIGTGYFSARTPEGNFSPEEFRKRALLPQVKMIEIKLSQGAKPGHGGILPAAKVSKEISEIRGVAMGKDVLSPPSHTAFSNPIGMMEFVSQLRELSNGKPIGIKLCLGKRREFLALCKAMLKTNTYPDFITVDGAEGGTGAAPLEFSNYVGTPLNEAISFIHNALVGINARNKIKLIASGKITTGFAIAQKIALGADLCNSARGMMFALGCIQALRCNSNTCPTGVATQKPELIAGLDVNDKSYRVANFQKNTVHSFLEILGASGMTHPSELRPWHIMKRISLTEVKHYGELYQHIKPGSLLSDELPVNFSRPWKMANPDTFDAEAL